MRYVFAIICCVCIELHMYGVAAIVALACIDNIIREVAKEEREK